MTEISKDYRIMLIINISISILFAIPYMFMINTIKPFIGYTASTPWYAQVFATVLFLIGVWILRAILQKKSFEDVSYFLEFFFAVLFGMIIYFALELIFVKPTGNALIFSWVETGVTVALFISNMIYYFVETAKHK